IAVAGGSSIYVSIQVSGSQTVSAVADSEGNVYTKAIGSTNGTLDIEIWYFDNVASSAGLIVTATLSGAANVAIEVAEIRGAANPSLDAAAGGSGHSLIGSATVTTTTVNDFGILSIATANNGNQSFSA